MPKASESGKKPPVRVAHVINDLCLGGAQRVIEVILQHLPTEDFEVTVYALRGGEVFDQRIASLGAKVVKWPRSPLAMPSTFLRFINEMRRKRYDVIHLHLSIAQLFWGLAKPLLPACTQVIVHKHSQLTLKSMRDNISLRQKILDSMARTLGRRPDVIISCSDIVGEQCRAVYPLADDKIITVYNAVNLGDIDNARPVPRKAFAPEAEGRPLVGFVGRLNPPKGLEVLLDAWVQVVKQHPDAHLALVGDGPLRMELEAQAKRLGIRSSIIFCGYSDTVPGILKSLDLYVQPSRWEGLPVSVTEAMAAGLAVVATDIPGNQEAVEHGVSGLLVPLNDADRLAQALCTLLADEQKRALMGSAGRKRVEAQFDGSVAAAKIADIYNTLAGRCTQRPG